MGTGNEVSTIEPAFSFLNELATIEPAKKKWNCTGAYLQKHRPDLYAAVVEALCEPGVSIRSICRAYPVTDDTVKAVGARESENLAALKKSRIGTARHVQRLALDRIAETVTTASCKDAGIVYGIVTEKVELESGNATQRIESIDGGRKLHAQFLELHEALMKQADAKVIDSHIGSSGESGATKAPALYEGQSDSQSDVLTDLSQESSSDPADLTDNLGAQSDPLRQGTGEGGVRSADPPLPISNP